MKELELKFTGKGEVKDFNFTQLRKSDKAYLYVVESEGSIHYEVFSKKTDFLYDFENKQRLSDKYVRYPKSYDFGIWAWTFMDLNKSLDKYHEINNKVKKVKNPL